MSKLDYLTIAIVTICLAALIYLIVKVVNLNQGEPGPLLPADEFTETEETGERELLPADTAAFPGESNPAVTEFPAEEEPEAEAEEQAAPGEYDPVRTMDRPTDVGSSGDFLVVAGSFRQRHNAELLVRQLQQKGYRNAKIGFFNNGAYASAIVGRFRSATEAEAMVQELKTEHGVEAYVHQKRTAGQ